MNTEITLGERKFNLLKETERSKLLSFVKKQVSHLTFLKLEKTKLSEKKKQVIEKLVKTYQETIHYIIYMVESIDSRIKQVGKKTYEVLSLKPKEFNRELLKIEELLYF